MFSNDRNIEKIASLVESLKDYLGLQKRSLQLGFVEKTIRLLTVLILTIILAFLLLLVVIFLSFAAALALSLIMPVWGAFLILAIFYTILFAIVILNRRAWIEQPLVKILTSILTD